MASRMFDDAFLDGFTLRMASGQGRTEDVVAAVILLFEDHRETVGLRSG